MTRRTEFAANVSTIRKRLLCCLLLAASAACACMYVVRAASTLPACLSVLRSSRSQVRQQAPRGVRGVVITKSRIGDQPEVLMGEVLNQRSSRGRRGPQPEVLRNTALARTAAPSCHSKLASSTYRRGLTKQGLALVLTALLWILAWTSGVRLLELSTWSIEGW